MTLNPRLLKESFAELEPVADQALAYFYGRLFAERPDLRALFPPALDTQRDRLLRSLTRIVWGLDSIASLTGYLAALGRDHRKFGVVGEHYDAFGHALLATVRRYARDSWTAEVADAWSDVYAYITAEMLRAADDAAYKPPPWWVAQVVTHETPTTDLAVLTLRPDEPFGYRAGQYADVQSARWPRIWRSYSLAGAPRDDGLLRLHVRAVPGGWVSGALVRHTAVGDTLLLGAPAGTMVDEANAERDLLCVAGGTGLAPIKAIIEQVAASGTRRAIHLFHCVRSTRDLYDETDLARLAGAYPRLRSIPVVSAEPGFAGLRGTAAEVVPRLRRWTGHEVYVCGPEPMVRSTVAALHDVDVPPERIHHDTLATS